MTRRDLLSLFTAAPLFLLSFPFQKARRQEGGTIVLGLGENLDLYDGSVLRNVVVQLHGGSIQFMGSDVLVSGCHIQNNR